MATSNSKVELPLLPGETEEEARLNICRDFLNALAYIHASNSIIHRDLHPGNIFIFIAKRDGSRVVKVSSMIRGTLNG
jgi:serine/threonine protein kinase